MELTGWAVMKESSQLKAELDLVGVSHLSEPGVVHRRGGWVRETRAGESRVHTKGVMQQHATLGRVLRRFSNSKCFLEGFLEGACKGFSVKTTVLRRVLRGERFIEGA